MKLVWEVLSEAPLLAADSGNSAAHSRCPKQLFSVLGAPPRHSLSGAVGWGAALRCHVITPSCVLSLLAANSTDTG